MAILLPTLMGCGELTGVTEYTPGALAPKEDAASDRGTPDTRTTKDLEGDYHDELIPPTRAAFRLDRASQPTHPWIVFVSTDTETPIGCEKFAAADWNQHVPGAAVIHILELGTNAAGDYVVKKTSPPLGNEAAVGRTTQTSDVFKPEYATTGNVSVAVFTPTLTSGVFEVSFTGYFPVPAGPEEEGLDAGPVIETVRGSFDVPTCAVSW